MRKLLILFLMLAVSSMLIGATVYPFVENFNGSVPAGWVLTNVTHSTEASNLGMNGSRCLVGVLSEQARSASFSIRTPELVDIPTESVFRFQYRIVDSEGAAAPIGSHVITVRANDTVIHTINTSTHSTSANFRLMQVNVPGALMGENATFSFTGVAGASDDITFLLDDVGVVWRDFTAVSFVPPALFGIGSDLQIPFTVRNTGGHIPTAYNLQLRCQRGFVANQIFFGEEGAPPAPYIGLGAEHVFTFNWEVGEWQSGITSLYARVVWNADINQEDNTTAAVPVRMFGDGFRIVAIGDPTSTLTSNIIPVSTSTNASYSQTLYRASDLGGAGDISFLAYRFTGTGAMEYPAEIQIFMRNSPLTEFAGNAPLTDMTGFTQVFHEEILTQRPGTNTIVIPLDRAFTYTGESLIVMVNRPSQADLDANSVWQMTGLSAGNRVVYETSSTSFNMTNFAGSVVNPRATTNIPNTTFVFDSPRHSVPYFVDFNDTWSPPPYWITSGFISSEGGIGGSGALSHGLNEWSESFTTTTRRIGDIPAGAVLVFHYLILNGDWPPAPGLIGDHTISIQIGDHTMHTISSENHTTSATFVPVAVPLTLFVGNTIRISWHGQRGTGADINFLIDDVHVYVPPAVDLSIGTLTGPTMIVGGVPTTHTVSLANMGSSAFSNYTLTLRSTTGVQLATVPAITMQPFTMRNVEIRWTPTVDGFMGIYARLTVDGENQSSNTLDAYISPEGAFLPLVGNPASTTTTQEVPIATRFAHNVNQILYLESEIRFTGLIDKVMFNYTGPSGGRLATPFNIKLYMATTNLTNLGATDWVDYDRFTLAFDGTVDLSRDEDRLISIELDEAYEYLGGGLVVMIHSTHTNAITPAFQRAHWQTTNIGGRTLHVRGANPIDPADPTGILARNFRPNTRFEIRGNPIPPPGVPFIETFDASTLPVDWVINNMVLTDTGGTTNGFNGTRALRAWITSGELNASATSLTIGPIPEGAVFRFLYRVITNEGEARPIGDNVINVYVNNELKITIDSDNHTPTSNFRTAAVFLDDFVDEFVQLRWEVLVAQSGSLIGFFMIDNVEIFVPEEHDLIAQSLNGPDRLSVGSPARYTLTVFNEGAVATSDFTIQLLAVGEVVPLATTPGRLIQPQTAMDFILEWRPQEEGSFDIYAKVIFALDSNPDDNETDPISVQVFPRGVRVAYIGNPNSAQRGFLYPISYHRESSISQIIYFENEINAFGDITQISYSFDGSGNLSADMTVSIYMTTIAASVPFTNRTHWVDFEQFEEVFTGNLPVSERGTYDVAFDLDTPFSYTGGNLIIMVHRHQIPWLMEFDETWLVTSANRTRVLSHAIDGVIDPANPQASESEWEYINPWQNIPNITILFAARTDVGDLEGVVKFDGEPLEGVTVTIEELDMTVETDETGTFFFEFIVEGVYTVTATKYGFMPFEDDEVEIVALEVTELIINKMLDPTPPAINVVAEIEDDLVIVTWELAERALRGFNLYRALYDEKDDVEKWEELELESEEMMFLDFWWAALWDGEYVYIVTVDYDTAVGEFTTAPAFSNVVEKYTPLPPAENVVAEIVGDYVELTWESIERFLLGFNIYRALKDEVDDEDKWVELELELEANEYTDRTWLTLPIGEYVYIVVAIHVTAMGELLSEPAFSNAVAKVVSDSDMDSIPLVTALNANFPNPFNPETTIRFSVATDSPVTIEIYNIRGQRVITLVDDVFTAGRYQAVWRGIDGNGRTVGSGIYFYRMRAGEFVETRRMILLK